MRGEAMLAGWKKTLAEAWPAIGHWMKSHEHG
jgi:hypothetical protein